MALAFGDQKTFFLPSRLLHHPEQDNKVALAKHIRRHSSVPKPSSRTCLSSNGKRSPGAKEVEARCANSLSPYVCIGESGLRLVRLTIVVFIREPRDGSSLNVCCQRKKETTNITLAISLRILHYSSWQPSCVADGLLSSSTRKPNRNAASETIRGDSGMGYLAILLLSCWPTVSSSFNECKWSTTPRTHLFPLYQGSLFHLFIEISSSGFSRIWYSGGLPLIM